LSTGAPTRTYYDAGGEKYVESYPAVDIE